MFMDTIIFYLFYNALFAVASFSILNILNTPLNINIKSTKWFIYYVLFHDPLLCIYKLAKWSMKKSSHCFCLYMIYIKKWLVIKNEMHSKNGECFCLWQAYCLLPLSVFWLSNIFFSFWTLSWVSWVIPALFRELWHFLEKLVSWFHLNCPVLLCQHLGL